MTAGSWMPWLASAFNSPRSPSVGYRRVSRGVWIHSPNSGQSRSRFIELGPDRARLVRVDRVCRQSLRPGQRHGVVDCPDANQLARGVQLLRRLGFDRRPVRTEDVRLRVVHDAQDVDRARGLEDTGQDLRLEFGDAPDRAVVEG